MLQKNTTMTIKSWLYNNWYGPENMIMCPYCNKKQEFAKYWNYQRCNKCEQYIYDIRDMP